MEKKIKIAFDLDGVIIDKPPIIPKRLLERLFRGDGGKSLHYRFPASKIEQAIRKISHFYLFRPPIRKNIEFIRELTKDKRYELYIVSARYSFIEKETFKWLEKRKINNIFKGIYLNIKDEQPHLFKEKILSELKPDIFIDDDGLIADYLGEKFINIKICCFSQGKQPCLRAKKIKALKDSVL